jgi:hypothetical protein
VAQRVAEHVVRRRLFGTRQLLRVDLHGVSFFGAGDEKVLIRWEWVEGIDVDLGEVVVRSATDTITFPAGAFGLRPEGLAEELRAARSIQDRSDVIRRLSGGTAGAGAG